MCVSLYAENKTAAKSNDTERKWAPPPAEKILTWEIEQAHHHRTPKKARAPKIISAAQGSSTLPPVPANVCGFEDVCLEGLYVLVTPF